MNSIDQQNLSNESRNPLLRILGCATLEQCRKIQKGTIFIRRFSKWIALCSIGITASMGYWVNYFQSKAERYIKEYDELVESKIVNWFYDAPSTKWIKDIIKYYQTIDKIQSILLILITAYTIRWIYADSVVRGKGTKGFMMELFVILLFNKIIYFIFTSGVFFNPLDDGA